MNNPTSDALVFFGATGDLAYKMIFPALQAMVKRGHLDVPVVWSGESGLDPRPVSRPRSRQPGEARGSRCQGV